MSPIKYQITSTSYRGHYKCYQTNPFRGSQSVKSLTCEGKAPGPLMSEIKLKTSATVQMALLWYKCLSDMLFQVAIYLRCSYIPVLMYTICAWGSGSSAITQVCANAARNVPSRHPFSPSKKQAGILLPLQ